eukprot:jgi/Tetstr1/441880/TSEL_030090.t1
MVGSNKALGNAAKPVANGHPAGNGNGGHDSRKKSKAANMSKRNRGDDAPPVATNGRHTNNGKRQKSIDGKQKGVWKGSSFSNSIAILKEELGPRFLECFLRSLISKGPMPARGGTELLEALSKETCCQRRFGSHLRRTPVAVVEMRA